MSWTAVAAGSPRRVRPVADVSPAENLDWPLIERRLNERYTITDEPILVQTTTHFAFTPIMFRHPIAACRVCRNFRGWD